jgi:DNA polymerase-3 subunit delta'
MNDQEHTSFTPFSEIIGQERAVGFLKRVMAAKKIPHAYLFVGIPGIGKTTTALAFTRAMNCREPSDGEGCGLCPTCRQVMSGNFPDIQFINPIGRYIKIEQIRELNRTLGFKPVTGGYRVSMVRRAEAMTEEAANSFLKTLEEPPERNILILNVTEPLDLLPTIVSRCQKIGFRPISGPLIARWLAEKKGIDEERAFVLARISEGSPGRAVDMLEEEFLEKRQDYIFQLIELSTLSPAQALDVALKYSGKGKRKAPEAPEQGQVGVLHVLSTWKTWYRDLLLLKIEGPEDLLINVDFSRKLKKISKNHNIENLVQSLLLLEEAQKDFLRSRNPDLLMENTVLSLQGLAK